MDNSNKSNVENEDEETLFARSLVPKLKQLNRSTCELAKLHIQQYLFSLEYPQYSNEHEELQPLGRAGMRQ